MTFVGDVKHLWRAVEIAPVIEKALDSQPEALLPEDCLTSTTQIANKIAQLTINIFEEPPKTLDRTQLINVVFAGYANLFEEKFSTKNLILDEYMLISIARSFANNEVENPDGSLVTQAEFILSLMNQWDSSVKKSRSNTF